MDSCPTEEPFLALGLDEKSFNADDSSYPEAKQADVELRLTQAVAGRLSFVCSLIN